MNIEDMWKPDDEQQDNHDLAQEHDANYDANVDDEPHQPSYEPQPPQQQQAAKKPRASKGMKTIPAKPKKRRKADYEIIQNEMDRPDLNAYFDEYDTPRQDRILICRKFAAYEFSCSKKHDEN